MKKIEEFYCIQTNDAHSSVENQIRGFCTIKQELIRPEIFIDNYSLYENAKKQRSKLLTFNPSGNLKLNFTEEELVYLSNIFSFEIIKRESSGYKLAKISNDDRFSIVYLSWVLSHLEKEYIIIKSKRWQFDYQPRGAGEDARGEDVTYIHGIWENPELPENIMKKIKGEF
ncbi:hypothetical protein FLACOL_02086 [Flavobacterium columnare]|uniref:Uncharacterized protein n=2 Tax=Flavobacterium TaxID=237 RepID=A0ABW8PQS0_9FLAO|nr:hypothetical protein [Flavobacterium columnare]SPE78071.1 hypothetical protein FLACOL_02086 [Flavobacterium columnare]